MIVLAGDIGGTNSRLLVSDVENSDYKILAEKSYPSNLYDSLPQVIHRFISEHKIKDKIESACFSVAGPVKSGASKITNLPWLVSERQLIQDINVPAVKLINDFEAVALGISMLNDEDYLIVQKGSIDSTHPDAAVIGAGTGLGASHRVWIEDQYHILSSETGHIGFSPANKLQTDLLSWLQTNDQYISLETVLSGKGINTIYQYLSRQEEYVESELLKSVIQQADPAQVITEHGLAGDDALCAKTIEIFVEIYGATAGDVVLHYYPVDELYIAGGIAPKLKDKISSNLFIDAFSNKGLMAENMKKITIKLILNEKVGLLGALSILLK